MSRLFPLALLALAAPLAAQSSRGATASPPVNVIRPSAPAITEAAPAPPTESHTIFFNGKGGYSGEIAGAGMAISSGGSALPQSYPESQTRTVLLGSYPLFYDDYPRRPFRLEPSSPAAAARGTPGAPSTAYGYKPATVAVPRPTLKPSRRPQ